MLEQLLRNEQRHQNLVRRRVGHLHRPQPAVHAYNDAVHHKGRGHGLGPPFTSAWAGLVRGLITEGTKLGEVLAWLSDHMEELNRLSIEYCRIEKSYQPLQRKVTLAAPREGIGNVAGRKKVRRVLERHWHGKLKTGLVGL